jgi:spore coat-associated protein N
MKNVKKALIGTALAGTLVIGAGAGTYSWFNASYKASGEITNHTLTINGETSALETVAFDGDLAPGRTVNGGFSFENTGSMEQVVRAGLDFQLKDKNGNPISTPSKDDYLVTATVTYNGTTYPAVSGNADVIDQYFAGNTWRPNANGVGGFMPGDKVEVALQVKLNEGAGNEYQGKKLYGELVIDAKQTDTDATFN